MAWGSNLMSNCVFCGIVSGEEPSSPIFENERTLAVMSLFPFSEGHCLVLPKRHYASLAELDEAVGREMFTQAQRLAQSVGEVVSCDWVQLMMHDDVRKGAHLLEPFHLHLHVLPRTYGVPYVEERPAIALREVLDAFAFRIREVHLNRSSSR